VRDFGISQLDRVIFIVGDVRRSGSTGSVGVGLQSLLLINVTDHLNSGAHKRRGISALVLMDVSHDCKLDRLIRDHLDLFHKRIVVHLAQALRIHNHESVVRHAYQAVRTGSGNHGQAWLHHHRCLRSAASAAAPTASTTRATGGRTLLRQRGQRHSEQQSGDKNRCKNIFSRHGSSQEYGLHMTVRILWEFATAAKEIQPITEGAALRNTGIQDLEQRAANAKCN